VRRLVLLLALAAGLALAGGYWSPYTGLGWVGDGWWVQVQVRYTPGGVAGAALLGGISW